MFENQQRAWVRQPSGCRLDLINPDPNSWEDEDLAIGLSRTYRWGGHSIWGRPMSVAQHSILVLVLRERLTGKLSRVESLRELLHDAEEGLIGFDPISPLKPVLGDVFAQLLERLTAAVFERYNLPAWSPEDKRLHKLADHLAAASEAVHVAGWKPLEVKETLGIVTEPIREDPLVGIYGGKPWEPWPNEVAAERFLNMLQSLTYPLREAA